MTALPPEPEIRRGIENVFPVSFDGTASKSVGSRPGSRSRPTATRVLTRVSGTKVGPTESREHRVRANAEAHSCRSRAQVADRADRAKIPCRGNSAALTSQLDDIYE